MVAAKQTQLATKYTKYQRTRKRHSEVVEVEISSAESFCSTSQFFVLRPPHKRKSRPLLHKLASLCSV